MPWLFGGAAILIYAIISGQGQALAGYLARPDASLLGSPYQALQGTPASPVAIGTATYAGQSAALSPSYTSTDAIATPTYASAPAPAPAPAAPAPIAIGGYTPPWIGSGYKPVPTPQLNPVYTQLQVAYPPSISSPNQTQITPRSGHISF